MRKVFIYCDTIAEAREAAPWAAIIIHAEGGFWAFESHADFVTWRSQK